MARTMRGKRGLDNVLSPVSGMDKGEENDGPEAPAGVAGVFMEDMSRVTAPENGLSLLILRGVWRVSRKGRGRGWPASVKTKKVVDIAVLSIKNHEEEKTREKKSEKR